MARTADPRARFWRWFRDNGVQLRDRIYGEDTDARDEAAEELRQAGAAVQEGMVLECGPMAAEVRTLIVSADGQPELVDTVKEFVAEAPALPGWEISAFRPRMDVGDSIVIRLEDEEVGPADIWFRIEEGADGLDLTLAVRGLTEENERLRRLGAVLLTQHTVGELDTLTLLGSLDFEALPDDPAAEGYRPFSELPDVFAESGEKRYPPVGSLPLDPEGQCQMMQGTISGAPALVLLYVEMQRWAGHPRYDRRLVVSIHFNQVRDDGMAETEEEHTEVQEIGERIAESLGEDQQSLLTLEITTQGRRDLVFYSSDAEAALERLEELRPSIWSHSLETAVEYDTFWGAYQSFLEGGQESGADEEE